MFYSKQLIISLGFNSIEEFVQEYTRKHNNCYISYRNDGVYLTYDNDSEPGMENLGYLMEE